MWNLDVHLPAEQKGTHMSRFVALLEENKAPLDQATFRTMLASMLEKLEARGGPHRGVVSVFREQDRAGFGRAKPAGL